jgi:hypothetical protein
LKIDFVRGVTMKKEIEEILNDLCNCIKSCKDKEVAADKIISLIEKEIGECKDDILRYMFDIRLDYKISNIDLVAQDIINIIKGKLNE